MASQRWTLSDNLQKGFDETISSGIVALNVKNKLDLH